MADQGEQYELSWILHHILDRYIGCPEMVAVRRRLTVVEEHKENAEKRSFDYFYTGSSAEGMKMQGSDTDMMLIHKHVVVLSLDQDTSIPPDNTATTLLMLRDAESRPGYVTLELDHLGQKKDTHLMKSIVQIQDVRYISSEMYKQSHSDQFSDKSQSNTETHGPATNWKDEHRASSSFDIVHSFPCYSWPREAQEWVSRPRFNKWPDKALRDQIVQGGCHLVPVGDKTSSYELLQWRISFTTAERKLIHSLTHVHVLVYGLLKYFLKQISGELEQLLGGADILSSYIIKTAIFYAVENTSESFWQEKHTFLCFMFCFKILITWVKAGYCPNYFINSNNMFHGKVHGENQQKLLRFLIELYNMKWKCLSVGTFIQPTIGEHIQSVRNGAWTYVLPSPTRLEDYCDIIIFTETVNSMCSSNVLPLSLKAHLSEPKSDMDGFIAYITTAQILSYVGMETFGEHIAVRGNKEKYKYLRRCKKFLTPLASVCTSPGLLTLATYHYQTGNYRKTLEMCGHMISSFKLYVGGRIIKNRDRYEHLFCGRGYTLLHKCREACVARMAFPENASKFCPSQLHQEFTKGSIPIQIPPLPYAVFLSFLCYHELGDTRRRDTALIHLRAVKYDVEQGGGDHWIVHNLLGICFEMVGDTRRALREYRDSLGVRALYQFLNPAMERIERLQHSE